MKLTLYNMNVLDALARMQSESVDCIVTSPPYYGLRSYGKETEAIWGAKEGCQHEFSNSIFKNQSGGSNGLAPEYNDTARKFTSSSCILCGAWKGQLGLEPTYQLYLQHMLQITAELKRVLKSTGTMWWNCGDSYVGNQGKRSGWTYNSMSGETNEEAVENGIAVNLKADYGVIADKSRMMLPERFAMKLIDEQQWTLRNDIVWSKPNHMPSSVKDRLSNGWEHIYLFTKARRYYFNLDAIRESHTSKPMAKQNPKNAINPLANMRTQNPKNAINPLANMRTQNPKNAINPLANMRTRPMSLEDNFNPLGKNPGDVWEINTHPYREAHFATFPPALPERCIKAGCPDNGTVLDPFAGSGTTLMVAMHRRLNVIGIEIKPDYCKLIEKRCGIPNLTYEYELIKC